MKYLFTILLFVVISISNYTLCKAQRLDDHPKIQLIDFNYKNQQVINYARTFIGTPYRWGANGPKAFDCSGFTKYVFENILGIKLHRTANNQQFNGVLVTNRLQPGDLVFFKGRKSRGIGHVGIVTESYFDGTFKFIHAACSGVRESYSTESYYQRRYIKAVRPLDVIYNS